MRQSHLLLLAAAAMVFCAAGASAQERVTPIRITAPWQLLLFPANDAEMANAINDLVTVGYTPVGLEVAPGRGLEILLVKEGPDVARWAIQELTDWNQLEALVTASIRDGFVPMDISRTDAGLAILWVETDLPVGRWRISTSGNTPGERDATVAEFESRGFTLYGISLHENLFWYLFLDTGTVEPALISSYDRGGAVDDGMVLAFEEGWLPRGIASDETAMIVGYVR